MAISNKIGLIIDEAKFNHLFGAVPIQKNYYGYIYPFEIKNLDSQDERVQRNGYLVPCYFLVVTEERMSSTYLSDISDLFADRVEQLQCMRDLTPKLLEDVLKDMKSLVSTDLTDWTQKSSIKEHEKRYRWSFLRRRKHNKKILILGDGAVGKTSLVEVMKRGMSLETIFKEQEAIFEAGMSGESINPLNLYVRTEFFNSGSIDLEQVAINYLDVAGQLNPESGVHLIKDFQDTTFHNVDIILFLFDLSESETFYALRSWIEIANKYYSSRKRRKPHFILVANKADLESTIDREFITALLSKEDFRKYFELSCLKGTNVKDFREWLKEFISIL
ncbi:MAG: GTPase domain-containing protein [Promethearchaeota archaeon]